MGHKRFLRHGTILLFLAAMAWNVAPCWAVIVFEKGKSEPIRGFLISENSSQVVIQQLLPDGKLQERSLPRSEIEDMIQAVSTERLADLNREKPQAYRDYAEELAEKREDPEARATALRLFLIAAHLDPEKMGHSSLLGMVALARSPEEERKFRALAFLLDNEHDRGVLREPAGGTLALAALKKEDRAQLAALLRALREGRPDDARGMAKRPAMAATMQQVARIMTESDFATLRGGQRLPASLLRRVVTLELLLAGVPVPGDESGAELRRFGWSNLDDPSVAGPISRLSLATVTEFNPADCHFRDGKWVP